MTNHNHPYHLVDKSPWPLFASFGALILVGGLTTLFHTPTKSFFFLRFVSPCCNLYSLMTGHYSRGDLSRTSHNKSSMRIKMRNNLIYYFRNLFLSFVFLVLLSQ